MDLALVNLLNIKPLDTKNSLSTIEQGENADREDHTMVWEKPAVTEIALGAEINGYVYVDLKC